MGSKRDFNLFMLKAHAVLFGIGLLWGLCLLALAKLGPFFGVVVR